MGAGINKVTLLGNLGQNPETKYSKDGAEYCLFSVATDEVWRNAKGQKFESVCWHSVIAWKRLAGICSMYLHKGSRVYLEGKIQNDKYESEGSIKYFSRILLTDIRLLDGRETGTASGGTVHQPEKKNDNGFSLKAPSNDYGQKRDVTADGDDMPF